MCGASVGVAGVIGLLWSGAALSAVLTGHPAPHGHVLATLTAFRHLGDPSAAWGQPMGPAVLYWAATSALAAITVGIVLLAIRTAQRSGRRRNNDPRLADGVATRREVSRAAGEKVLLGRGDALRPSLTSPRPSDLGQQLGRSLGIGCWASVEDSIVVVGPPRSGKGLHIAVPAILDAPGAVITTSTRPDNLTATLTARWEQGPVAVFDPQRLAPGVPNSARWSPMRGCESPQTAMIRARALTAGAANGTSESTFWQSSAEQAVRCLLHAGALSGKSASDLYRWSLSAVLATEAVATLTEDPHAAPGWANALNAILAADQKQRDSVWAMVGIAFACLADPHVLDAVSPTEGDAFDPELFLRNRGTVYLLGTSSGAGATSGLVGAFVEDVIEAARRLAARSPGARLDPPLSLVLDEAANYRLPSLASLMSEGGGTGISTLLVLQSLAQARAVWGDHEGAALWDSAVVKVILGGGSNARDLDDLSKLIGTRTDRQITESTGPAGHHTRSVSTHDVAILEPGQLRQLPFGTGMLLLRSARPIMLDLQRWIDRPDAPGLLAAQQRLEGLIRNGHAALTD
jgi:type IV secretory pathway TraG/TraD family ATPase VirD4